MNPRQRRFVEEYLLDLNAAQAGLRAGYRGAATGSRLLRRPEILSAVREEMKIRQERTEITQDQVLRELAAIGFARTTDYAQVRQDSVLVVDTDQLSDAQKSAIAAIEPGSGGVRVKLYDKVKALELLGKHLGMFDGKAAVPVPENNLLERLLEATAVDLPRGQVPQEAWGR